MKRGFTLIELLVVVAIIGMLSSVVLASLNTARSTARTTTAVQDLKQLQTALELYYNDNNAYPSSIGGSGSWDGLYSNWGDDTANWIAGLAPTYIAALPRSPNNSTSGADNYIYNSNGQNYKLLWHSPEDCDGIKMRIPSVLDPKRDGGSNDSVQEYGGYCWAIGIWTEGAVSW